MECATCQERKSEYFVLCFQKSMSEKCPLKQLFSKGIPQLTTAALPGNVLEMPILRAQPRQNQTFWDSGPAIYILLSLTIESVHIFCLRVRWVLFVSHCLKKYWETNQKINVTRQTKSHTPKCESTLLQSLLEVDKNQGISRQTHTQENPILYGGHKFLKPLS